MNLVKTKEMVSKIGQVKPCSKKDPFGICGRKTMVKAVLCKSCGNWIHGRCAKTKIVTNRHAVDFKCRKFKWYHKHIDKNEKLNDDVNTVTKF